MAVLILEAHPQVLQRHFGARDEFRLDEPIRFTTVVNELERLRAPMGIQRGMRAPWKEVLIGAARCDVGLAEP